MKRYMLIIIIFAVISIGVTAIMIGITNNSVSKESDEYIQEQNANSNKNDVIKVVLENQSNTINTNITPSKVSNFNNEKTLDLYGTYNENDIIIEDATLNIGGNDITYPQISGLKNKAVEQKVNNRIKEKVVETFNKISNNEKVVNAKSKYEIQSSFANTLSMTMSCTCENGGKGLCLNFELVNGEELKLEDMFTTNTDIGILVRMPLYRGQASQLLGKDYGYDEYDFSSLHYDLDKKVWLITHYEYDNNYKILEEKEIEYVPTLTDYEIEKRVKKFINTEEKYFYYTPSALIMDDYYWINLDDIADKVVIYDKYLTSYDLYEKNDIGRKGIINCSQESYYSDTRETKYFGNNLFYDIDVVGPYEGYNDYQNRDNTEDILKKYKNNKSTQELNLLKEQIENYKEIALKNPNKFYCVFLRSSLNNNHNLLEISKRSIVFTCDIQNKNKLLDNVLECYRYYNLHFYGGTGYGYLTGDRAPSMQSYIEKVNGELDDNLEDHYYNIFNNREITLIGELFIDGVDYEDILKKETIYPNDTFDYDYNLSYITLISQEHYNKYGNKWTKDIMYDKIKDYVIVRDVQEYVLDESSTRQYEKSELEGLTKDQLTIAYNEPFAKHGHDFKTQYLKDYFNNWDWYTPISGKVVGMEELNEFEKYNVELIRNEINER